MNGAHTIRLYRHGSSWTAWVENPHGGGGNAGGTRCPRWAALADALRQVPSGAAYVVEHDGKQLGSSVKRAGCAHGYSYERGCPFDRRDEADALLGSARKLPRVRR